MKPSALDPTESQIASAQPDGSAKAAESAELFRAYLEENRASDVPPLPPEAFERASFY